MGIFGRVMGAPQIAVTWSEYFAAAAISAAGDAWVARRQATTNTGGFTHFPANLRTSKSAQLDMKVYVFGKFTGATWGAPEAFLAATLPVTVVNAFGKLLPNVHYDGRAITAGTAGLALFLAIELADFISHYYQHKVPALWELHKVHHSAESLNPLTAKRGHPLSLIIEGVTRSLLIAVPAGAAMYFGGLTYTEISAARMAIMTVCNLMTLDTLRHSPFPVRFGPLERIFISPHMHQVHHSSLEPHWDKNFGTNLSVYDWLFRTAYKPSKDEPFELGLYGYDREQAARFHTWQGAFVSPPRKAWSKLASGAHETVGNSLSSRRKRPAVA